MSPTRTFQDLGRAASLALCTGLALAASAPSEGGGAGDPALLYAETFDTHWERLRDDYPYFELYGVDWDAERAEHRPRAVAAANDTEFAWELARMFDVLPDPHLFFMPAVKTMAGRWSYPEIDAHEINRRVHIIEWPEGEQPTTPSAYLDDPRAYPEVIEVQGFAPLGSAEILVAGPVGTLLEFRVRWPDGSESDHQLPRPAECNVPPPKPHYGERWLITGRVGSVGYMRIRTFNPERATLGPDGKMTTMLRAALTELSDTDSLILDLQGNGGGRVSASDPFLGSFLARTRSYRWGNAGGKRRVIRPGRPRYRGAVVALVDERSASGGEWAARILRDAQRATVVGGRTAGAEAAVHKSHGPDGSVLSFSAWPMIEPGVTPFQDKGIEIDHALPLTLEDARKYGLDEALDRVRRARLAQALAVLGAPASDLEAFVALADRSGDLAAQGKR